MEDNLENNFEENYDSNFENYLERNLENNLENNLDKNSESNLENNLENNIDKNLETNLDKNLENGEITEKNKNYTGNSGNRENRENNENIEKTCFQIKTKKVEKIKTFDQSFFSLFEPPSATPYDDLEWKSLDEKYELKNVLSNIVREDLRKGYLNDKCDNETQKDDLDLLESVFLKINLNDGNKNQTDLYQTNIIKVKNMSVLNESIKNDCKENIDVCWSDYTPIQIQNGKTLLSMGFNIDLIKFVIKQHFETLDLHLIDLISYLQQLHIDNKEINLNIIILLYTKFKNDIENVNNIYLYN